MSPTTAVEERDWDNVEVWAGGTASDEDDSTAATVLDTAAFSFPPLLLASPDEDTEVLVSVATAVEVDEDEDNEDEEDEEDEEDDVDEDDEDDEDDEEDSPGVASDDPDAFDATAAATASEVLIPLASFAR